MKGSAATVIHEARTLAGLSQRELARRAGTSQAVISAYENKRRDPVLAHLVAIVQAAGYELDLRLVDREPATGVTANARVWEAADSAEDDDRILDNLRLSPAGRLRRMGAFRDFSAKHRGALQRR